MANKGKVQHNEKRRKMVSNKASKRAELKAVIYDKQRPMEERFQASLKLAEMPRNSSKVRVRNRCALTGRPRSYIRRFDLSRIAVRDLAAIGELPGVTKSSW